MLLEGWDLADVYAEENYSANLATPPPGQMEEAGELASHLAMSHTSRGAEECRYPSEPRVCVFLHVKYSFRQAFTQSVLPGNKKRGLPGDRL